MEIEKLYTSTTFLKMSGGRMHTLHPTPPPLDPSLAVNYRNHQVSLTYFSYLASLILFFFTKNHSQKGMGGMALRSCFGSPILFIDAYLNEVTLSHSTWSVELRFAELFSFTFLRNSDVDQSTQLN